MTYLSSPISFGHFKLFSVKFYPFSNYLTINPFADVLFHFSVPSLIFKKVNNFFVKTQREKIAPNYIEAPNCNKKNLSNHNEIKSSSHSGSDFEV